MNHLGPTLLPTHFNCSNPRIIGKQSESLWNHCGIIPESFSPGPQPRGRKKMWKKKKRKDKQIKKRKKRKNTTQKRKKKKGRGSR